MAAAEAAIKCGIQISGAIRARSRATDDASSSQLLLDDLCRECKEEAGRKVVEVWTYFMNDAESSIEEFR